MLNQETNGELRDGAEIHQAKGVETMDDGVEGCLAKGLRRWSNTKLSGYVA